MRKRNVKEGVGSTHSKRQLDSNSMRNVDYSIGSAHLKDQVAPDTKPEYLIDLLSKECPENNTLQLQFFNFISLKIGKHVFDEVIIVLIFLSVLKIIDKISAKIIKSEIKPDKTTSSSSEKILRQQDLEVKEQISKELGLYNVKEPTITILGEEEKKEVEYLVDSIVKVGDRLVLASPPGHGKSVLATQLGISIAKGTIPEFLVSEVKPCKPQKVFLFDGEMDTIDIGSRYGGLDPITNFIRLTGCKFRTIYYLMLKIWRYAKNAREDLTIILDNIFALMPTMTTEETRTFFDGLDLIQQKMLENGHNLTYIIVTHTTKETNGNPTLKDVAGSAHITRFAKSVMSLSQNEQGITILEGQKRRYDKNGGRYTMKMVTEPYYHFVYAENKGAAKNMTSNSSYDENVRRKIFNLRNITDEKGKNMSYNKIAEKLKVEKVNISHTQVKNLYERFCKELRKRIGDWLSESLTDEEICERLTGEGLEINVNILQNHKVPYEANGVIDNEALE